MRSLVLLLCLVVTGAGADPASTSIRIRNSVGSSTSVTTSTGGDSNAQVVTSTTSSASSACSLASRGQRCEVTCPAPTVARCVQPHEERSPRCSCR